jgi:hypothetical protein
MTCGVNLSFPWNKNVEVIVENTHSQFVDVCITCHKDVCGSKCSMKNIWCLYVVINENANPSILCIRCEDYVHVNMVQKSYEYGAKNHPLSIYHDFTSLPPTSIINRSLNKESHDTWVIYVIVIMMISLVICVRVHVYRSKQWRKGAHKPSKSIVIVCLPHPMKPHRGLIHESVVGFKNHSSLSPCLTKPHRGLTYENASKIISLPLQTSHALIIITQKQTQ